MKTMCGICWRHRDDASPCRYCLRKTCAECHLDEKHLKLCPETRRHETSRR